MVYIDTRGMSQEEKTKKKRQLTMQKISYESDLKKWNRKELELKDDMTRFKKDRARIDAHIRDVELENKKILDKEMFLEDELKRIKKKLIELG